MLYIVCWYLQVWRNCTKQLIHWFRGYRPKSEKWLFVLLTLTKHEGSIYENVPIARSVKHLAQRHPSSTGYSSNFVISRSNTPHGGGSSTHSYTNIRLNIILNFETITYFLTPSPLDLHIKQLQHCRASRYTFIFATLFMPLHADTLHLACTNPVKNTQDITDMLFIVSWHAPCVPWCSLMCTFVNYEPDRASIHPQRSVTTHVFLGWDGRATR